jgi:hypothetical protein
MTERADHRQAVDEPGQLAIRVAFEHGLHELALDAPGGVIGDAEPALERERRDGASLLGKQVHGEKPGGQLRLRRDEDRARGQRGSMATVLAPQPVRHGIM